MVSSAMTLNGPNLGFMVTVLFKVEYISKTVHFRDKVTSGC